jgi:hypothetical protein
VGRTANPLRCGKKSTRGGVSLSACHRRSATSSASAAAPGRVVSAVPVNIARDRDRAMPKQVGDLFDVHAAL